MPIKRSAIAPVPVFSRARWSAAESQTAYRAKGVAIVRQLLRQIELVALDLFNQDSRTPVRVLCASTSNAGSSNC
jgi:hypothetical protein